MIGFILADEPTGNLDSKTTQVLNLLDELNSRGKTIVMVTHETEVAARARRVIVMKDGKIEKRVAASLQTFQYGCVRSRSHSQRGRIREKGEESLEKFRQGCLAEYRDPSMRSFLTAIGVFIGVASVIWLLAIGEGIAAEAEGEIMALGANNLILSSKRPSDEKRSTKEILLFVRAYEKRLCQDQQSGSASFGLLSDQEINNRTIFLQARQDAGRAFGMPAEL